MQEPSGRYCKNIIKCTNIILSFRLNQNSNFFWPFFRKFGCSLSYSAIALHTKCSLINGQTGKQTLSLRLFFKVLFPTTTSQGEGEPRSNQRMIIWWPKTIISSFFKKTKATKKAGKGCYGPFQSTMPQISWILR